MAKNKIKLTSEFDKVWWLIERGENITFLRYADGERAIMAGQAVIAQEGGWSSPSGASRLGQALTDSMSITGPNVFFAISCPCCDLPAYHWYRSRVPSGARITFANLWINANYKKFIRAFEALDREAVVIANFRSKDSRIGNLKVIKHYSISDDCFDFWDNHAQDLLAEIKKDLGGRRNILYVVSAGPMSEPIIADLYKNNPDNSYIDFGSSIDRYYRQKKTRPYEDPWSVYSRRNCWMHDPQTTDLGVSAVLTLYKRPEKLAEQLNALENQTLKPREILLFHDAASPRVELDESLKGRFSNYIKVDQNVGVWGRFAGGLLAKSPYVCFFDDDTIPGSRWLENCMTQMEKRPGLYGAIGIDAWNLRNYPYRGFRRWGWDGPCNSSKEVDFVGHAWFLRKDWLGVMWIGNSRFFDLKYVSEDMFLSYSLRKQFNVRTYVPPHPKGQVELYGSLPDKAARYGQEAGIAVSGNETQLAAMNRAAQMLIGIGMRPFHFRLSNFVSRDYLVELLADLLVPKGTARRKAVLNFIAAAKKRGMMVLDQLFPPQSRVRDILKKLIQHFK